MTSTVLPTHRAVVGGADFALYRQQRVVALALHVFEMSSLKRSMAVVPGRGCI